MKSGRNISLNVKISVFLVVLLLAISCKRKVVCPAFQSSYILNDSVRHQRFSLFGKDTLPRYDFLVSKSKYGMVEKVSYKRRVEEMKIIPMETIYPKRLDSLEKAKADSLSMMAINGEPPPTRYNMDQDFYIRLFGEYLPQPREITEELTEEKDSLIIAEPVEEKPKKGLFRRKNKDEKVTDSTDSIP